jgi:ribonuclease D
MEIFDCLFDTKKSNILKGVLGKNHLNHLKSVLNIHVLEYLQSNKPESLKYLKLICDLYHQVDEEEITKFPKYDTSNKKVIIVNDNLKMKTACKVIKRQSFVGYDTESKPVFQKEKPPNRIALIQIATREKCFLFQMGKLKNINPLLELLRCDDIRKICVGIRIDNTKIFQDFGCKVSNIIDLNEIFQEVGNKTTIGSRQMVARVLKKNLVKKRKISLSNWEIKSLSQQQIQYASDDAFSALEVFLRLKNLFKQFCHFTPKRILNLLAVE